MKNKFNSKDVCAVCGRKWETHIAVTGQCVAIGDTAYLSTSFQKQKSDKYKLFKVYVFDFGDTPLVVENIKDITDWLESDVTSIKKEGEEYSSTITIRYMTRRQINALPEWS